MHLHGRCPVRGLERAIDNTLVVWKDVIRVVKVLSQSTHACHNMIFQEQLSTERRAFPGSRENHKSTIVVVLDGLDS